MWKHPFRRVAMIAALGSIVAPFAAAQNQPEFGPTLEVHLRTLKHGGGVGISAFGNDALQPGTPVHWFVTAGSSSPSEQTVCGGGVASTGALADKLSRSAFVWEIRMVPSRFDAGAATFDLEWTRYQSDGGGRPAAEGKTTITLREGERQPIDFVRGAPGARQCGEDAALVEVGAGYTENPQLARAVLQYDLWLKHQQPNGQTIARRFTAMGRQGGGVDFVFAPLEFSLSGVEQSAYDLFTTVQGTIRGRLLQNGRIALSIDTSRRDGLGPRADGPSGGGGNAGRKALEVAADEAIEIELPAPGGVSSVPARQAIVSAAPRQLAGEPNRRQVVKTENGRLVVDNALFFQGQRTSLVLQVKPVRQ